MKLGFIGCASLTKVERRVLQRGYGQAVEPKPIRTIKHCACGQVISGNKEQCGNCARAIGSKVS